MRPERLIMESLTRKVTIAFVIAFFIAVALGIVALKAVYGGRQAVAKLGEIENENTELKVSKFLIEETLKRVIDKMNKIDDEWREAGEPTTYAGQYVKVTPENLSRFLRPCESKPRTIGCSRYKKRGERVPIYVGVLDLKPRD